MAHKARREAKAAEASPPRRADRSRLRTEGQPREIALAGAAVPYRLVRSRRRTIEIEINFSGLAVRAPMRIAMREIEAMLTERAAWIRGTIEQWERRRRAVLPAEWREGATIVFRGRELNLALREAREPAVAVDLIHFAVAHPTPADPLAIERFVTGWLAREAEVALGPRAAQYAARCGARIARFAVSKARSEWGSCNHKGEVRLSWRLIQLPPALADYVIAHEVAHLTRLDHSPRFWALVEQLYPGHAAARDELDEWSALLEA